MSDLLLAVDGIHASYIKKEILCGVSLTVFSGEIVGLLGGNGSGKSTILKVIAGLLLPVRGSIFFRNNEITHLNPNKRQNIGISILLQGGRVFPNISVLENFKIAVKHSRQDAYKKFEEPILGSIFHELSERKDTHAGLLSGGQRQMLAIEMMLAQRPALALLDEPTGSLSNDMAKTVLDGIKSQAEETGCGILLVEQNVSMAIEITSRNLHLVNGRIIL